MRYILLFLLFFSAMKGTEISQIYTLAHQNYCKTLRHPLYYRMGEKEGWVSINLDWIEFIKVDVDEKDGYLSFVDEGTGGGSTIVKAKLFPRDKDSGVLVVVETNYDGSFPTLQRVLAFGFVRVPKKSYGDDEFSIKKIDNPLPKLEIEDFARDDMSIGELKILKSLKPFLLYQLSPKSNKITAKLITRDETQEISILKECFEDKATCKELKEKYQIYYESIKPKLKKSIEIIYKQKESIFLLREGE